MPDATIVNGIRRKYRFIAIGTITCFVFAIPLLAIGYSVAGGLLGGVAIVGT